MAQIYLFFRKRPEFTPFRKRPEFTPFRKCINTLSLWVRMLHLNPLEKSDGPVNFNSTWILLHILAEQARS